MTFDGVSRANLLTREVRFTDKFKALLTVVYVLTLMTLWRPTAGYSVVRSREHMHVFMRKSGYRIHKSIPYSCEVSTKNVG